MPSLPGTDRGDGHQQYASALAQARSQAAAALGQRGWEVVYEFARSIKLPWFFGAALADAGVHEFERELTVLLDGDDATNVSLAASYFAARFRADGWAALEPMLTDQTLSPRQRARLLLEAHDYPAVWDRLGDPAVAGGYWREFRINGLGADFPHVATVVAALYEVGRYGAGLDMLNLYLRDDSGGEWADLVAVGLEALLTPQGADEVRQLSQYGLRTLFNYLERIGFDRDRLARLEWAYLPAFEFEPAPPTMARYLAENPAFFVDVVCRVHKPGDEDEREDEGEEARSVRRRRTRRRRRRTTSRRSRSRATATGCCRSGARCRAVTATRSTATSCVIGSTRRGRAFARSAACGSATTSSASYWPRARLTRTAPGLAAPFAKSLRRSRASRSSAGSRPRSSIASA
jgi:hypothetical protein